MTTNVSHQSGPTAVPAPRQTAGTRPHHGRAAVGVAAASAAAFVVSAAWYAALAEPYQQLRGVAATATPWWLAPVELGRSLVVATVVTLAVRALNVTTWATALQAAALAWVAFPVVLLVGSVVHEGVPPLLAAIHAGDWLVKLIVIAFVVRWFARETR